MVGSQPGKQRANQREHDGCPGGGCTDGVYGGPGRACTGWGRRGQASPSPLPPSPPTEFPNLLQVPKLLPSLSDTSLRPSPDLPPGSSRLLPKARRLGPGSLWILLAPLGSSGLLLAPPGSSWFRLARVTQKRARRKVRSDNRNTFWIPRDAAWLSKSASRLPGVSGGRRGQP